jgi:hypothetical protein
VKRVALVLAAGVATAAVLAAPPALPRHGLVMFTSECVSEQSGDGYGVRVTVRRIGKIDDLVLERADFPVEVIWPLMLDDTGRRMTFESRGGEPTAKTVEGLVSRDGMKLELRGLPLAAPDHLEVPRRVTDFSRPTPNCKGA